MDFNGVTFELLPCNARWWGKNLHSLSTWHVLEHKNCEG